MEFKGLPTSLAPETAHLNFIGIFAAAQAVAAEGRRHLGHRCRQRELRRAVLEPPAAAGALRGARVAARGAPGGGAAAQALEASGALGAGREGAECSGDQGGGEEPGREPGLHDNHFMMIYT